MVAPEAVTARVRRQHPDRLSTAGASRPEAHAIRRTAESLEVLGACSQYLMRRLRLSVHGEIVRVQSVTRYWIPQWSV